MEMRGIICEEFQKTAGKMEIQKNKKIKKAFQRPEMIPEMLAEKCTETAQDAVELRVPEEDSPSAEDCLQGTQPLATPGATVRT